MRRFTQAVGVGAVLITIAMITATLVAQSKPATSIPAPVTVSNGRWQVVNGRPEGARTIMLLDTATGNTWILCAGAEVGDQWCRVSRTEGTTAPEKEK